MKVSVICGPQSPVYCALLAPLTLSLGTRSPCNVSIAVTDFLPSPWAELSPLTPHVCPSSCLFFDCFLTFEYFAFFCQPSKLCTEYAIVSLKMLFFFFFFTFPTVVVTFYSIVLLWFVFCLSVNQMLASLKVIYTLCVIGCVLVKCFFFLNLIFKANYQSLMTWTTPLMTGLLCEYVNWQSLNWILQTFAVIRFDWIFQIIRSECYPD